ncbi:MAG: hypothetical protein KGI50_04955 [Patescibacteria group bacterium]|nr:hypothetical protein [Patescibacteria group bacterium]MDE2438611.1 hypothetical protein [Patescibacteria group bacterium]
MKNYDAWNIEPLRDMGDRHALYLNLIQWAILAPNSHNVQPWRFVIRARDHEIVLYVAKEGILPASDIIGRQAHISVGCALENLAQAAAYYGMTIVPHITHTEDKETCVRIVCSDPSAHAEEHDGVSLDSMRQRRVNRGKFDTARNLPEALIQSFHTYAQAGGLIFDSIRDIPTRLAIAQFQEQAEKYVLAHDAFRKELGNYFLPNATEEGRGMPGNTFGLGDETSLRVHRALQQEGPFDPDLANGMAVSARDAMKHSPLIGIISIEEDMPFYWIQAGRVLQRNLLEAERYGASTSIHAALIEVNFFNKLLRLRLKRSARPTVLFRAGFCTEERPHAPRAPIEGVVTVEKDRV